MSRSNTGNNPPGDHRVNLDIHEQELWWLVGPSGIRQEHALAHGPGLEEISSGTISIAPGRERRAAQRSRHRDGLPELRPLPAHERAREPRVRASSCARWRAPTSTAGRRRGEDLRDRALPRPAPQGAVGRPSGSGSRSAAPSLRKPAVFLFDERSPTSTPSCAVQMRAEIKKLQQRLQSTSIYVTHDQVEAMTMGSRIAILNAGHPAAGGHAARGLREASPTSSCQLHRMPPMNFVHCTVGDEGGSWRRSPLAAPRPRGARAALAAASARR